MSTDEADTQARAKAEKLAKLLIPFPDKNPDMLKHATDRILAFAEGERAAGERDEREALALLDEAAMTFRNYYAQAISRAKVEDFLARYAAFRARGSRSPEPETEPGTCRKCGAVPLTGTCSCYDPEEPAQPESPPRCRFCRDGVLFTRGLHDLGEDKELVLCIDGRTSVPGPAQARVEEWECRKCGYRTKNPEGARWCSRAKVTEHEFDPVAQVRVSPEEEKERLFRLGQRLATQAADAAVSELSAREPEEWPPNPTDPAYDKALQSREEERCLRHGIYCQGGSGQVVDPVAACRAWGPPKFAADPEKRGGE